MTVMRLLVAWFAAFGVLPLEGCGDTQTGAAGTGGGTGAGTGGGVSGGSNGDTGAGSGAGTGIGGEASVDRERGRLLLRQFGCGTCHAIPGVAAAAGNVGPTLSGVARRVYLSGVLPNTRENMARFIQSPHAYDPLTVMPDLQVSESQARDMVDYLYGLR